MEDPQLVDEDIFWVNLIEEGFLQKEILVVGSPAEDQLIAMEIGVRDMMVLLVNQGETFRKRWC